MPPRAISSPSRYRPAGFDTSAAMPTPVARPAAARGSSVVAAASLVRGGSRRGYSAMAVHCPEVVHNTGEGSPRGAPEPVLEPCRAEARIGPGRDPLAAHHRPVVSGLWVGDHLPLVPFRG